MATLPKLYTAKDVFDAVYDHAQNVIEFDPKWNNSTGYMDNAVYAQLDLQPGEIAKSVTPAPNNRRILLIGTPAGNICVFERYTAGQNGVFVSNAAMAVEKLFDLHSSISDEAMARLFGQAIGGEYFSSYNLEQRNAGAMLWSFLDEHQTFLAVKAKVDAKRLNS